MATFAPLVVTGRIDLDPSTGDFGLWPKVHHAKIGDVRVDGQPVHFSATDWHLERGAPCLGEHNDEVFAALETGAADPLRADDHHGGHRAAVNAGHAGSLRERTAAARFLSYPGQISLVADCGQPGRENG